MDNHSGEAPVFRRSCAMMNIMDVFVVLTVVLFRPSSTGSHTLQYHTVVSSQNTTAPTTTVELDGETFVSYSSSDTGFIPKTEWMKKINVGMPDYWKSEKSRMSGDHRDLQHHLSRVEELLHQTKGAPTLTRTYTCELHDDNTTRGSLQILYDGEDFIRLNLSSGTWTADNHQAEQFLKVWEHAEDEAKHWTCYLNYRCIKCLQQYLTYRNSVNQGGRSGGGSDGGADGRSGGGADGSSGGGADGGADGRSGGGAGGRAHARKFIIATVLVLVIVFIVALFLSYMREKLNSKTAVSTSV